jgi:hypothetical protein
MRVATQITPFGRSPGGRIGDQVAVQIGGYRVPSVASANYVA